MSLQDWIAKRRQEIEESGPRTAVSAGIQEVWQGGLRRVIGRRYSGDPIWDRTDEWDVLCILDACRVDLMKEVIDEYDWLPTENIVESVPSVGTTSEEWLHQTFDEKYSSQMEDVGYITANPFTDSPERHEKRWDNLPLEPSHFGFFHEAWKTTEPTDGDRIPSVSPYDMSQHALRAWRSREELGLDRLIVHYMQPHAPFRTHPEWNQGPTNVWEQHQRGAVDSGELWAAYVDNLRWVLDEVEVLQERIAGDIVLTADHGNAMGEWGVWAHPPESPVPQVRNVPWVPVEGAKEDGPFPDGPVVPREEIDFACNERLDALGYK